MPRPLFLFRKWSVSEVKIDGEEARFMTEGPTSRGILYGAASLKRKPP